MKYNDRVPVYHMGPPLTSLEPDPVASEDVPEGIAEEAPHTVETVAAHVVARLEDLSEDERQGMRRWHRKISVFFPAATRPARPQLRPGEELKWARFFTECRYIAHPAFKVEEDPVSDVKRHHSYSCVGFVTQCYESAAVERVLTDPNQPGFPTVDKETVKRTFLLGILEFTEEIAKAINLTGDGPWSIAMPGYVLRAFDRTDEDIRDHQYHPTTDDISFLASR
ncbi:MAG: hypothetical protein HQ567_17865 [Candidatus Nealsonbacteria bacterium]|nr:hypothetical protein [Candidatus Nealsonbacteria bacterium]